MASDLKYTVTLDTKGVVPMLKITRQQMDDVANSAKKANSHFQRMATICGQMKNITERSFTMRHREAISPELYMCGIQIFSRKTAR